MIERKIGADYMEAESGRKTVEENDLKHKFVIVCESREKKQQQQQEQPAVAGSNRKGHRSEHGGNSHGCERARAHNCRHVERASAYTHTVQEEWMIESRI